jgi:hypothetical protein
VKKPLDESGLFGLALRSTFKAQARVRRHERLLRLHRFFTYFNTFPICFFFFPVLNLIGIFPRNLMVYSIIPFLQEPVYSLSVIFE